MKKMICALMIALLLPSVCMAEIDLTGMSYDELIELSKQIGLAIMSHDGFDSVVVPRGLWKVGEDIPEGMWVLSSADGGIVNIVYGTVVDSSENSMNQFESENVGQSLKDDETWTVKAVDGNYFCITYGDVRFSSNTGSTGLGFKKK